MALRMRKSIKLGKNVRLNLNKNSVGMSVGGKLGRYSVNSKGRSTTTVHTPINGVSYVKTNSGGSKGSNSSTNSEVYAAPSKPMKTGGVMLVLTVFLGMFGVHRFVSGQVGMGILYLCTGGIFLIGWLHDIVYQVKNL